MYKSAKDRQETAKFYAEIFGWEYVSGRYPDDVLIYVNSNDLETDLKQIEARGGTVITRDMGIPGFGHLAFVGDPAGNRIVLWEAEPSQ
jgi:predicted enzyme related to lactoylglutathione lyase